jgi:peptidoglycan/LPS O-acetylase OafA/YrhL
MTMVRSPTRIVALDGLRAVAICGVLAAHAVDTTVTDELGSLGVSLFFVLSGFLITSLLLGEQARTATIDLRQFYLRRFRRIFPAYYLFLIVIGGTTIAGLTHVDPWAFVYDALYLRNYAFHVPPDWWTGHSWSLCIEEQFYSIWPVVLLLLGTRFGWRFAIACILGAPVLRVATYVLLPHYRTFIDVMLPTRIDMLMFGCALAMLIARSPETLARLSRTRLRITVVVLAAAVLVGIGLSVRFHGMYTFVIGYTLIGCAGAALIWYLVRYPQSMVGRFLCLRPVAWLGRISYSLYLWQQVFLTPGLNQTISGRFPFNLAASIAVAAASYYLVERRFFSAVPARIGTTESSVA